MSNVKKIMKKDEFLETDDNEVVFYLTYNDDMTEIVLMAKCKTPMMPTEYLDTLAQFINDASVNPDNLFVEDGVDVDREGYH